MSLTMYVSHFFNFFGVKSKEKSFVFDVAEKSIKHRIAGLDELRGLSILWVMICHGSSLSTLVPNTFGGYGFHGVVLFFMISGYLITQILIKNQLENTSVGIFYIRRIFRIWPLFILALICSGILWPEKIKSLPYYLLFVNNFAYAFGHGEDLMVRTDVMWSLAMEEQFYLLWPLVALSINRKFLPWFLFCIIVVGFLFDSGTLHSTGPAFKNTQGCMQYIAMGALLAFGRKTVLLGLGAIPVLVLIWGLTKGFGETINNFRWIWYGITYLLFLVLYVFVYIKPLIKFEPLAIMGRLCYGLYLIHFFISWATLAYFGENVMLTMSVYFVTSIVLALLSFYYFENPIMKLRIKFEKSTILQYRLMAVVATVFLVSIVSLIK